MKSDKKEDKDTDTREKERTKNKEKHKNREREKSRDKDKEKEKGRNKSEKENKEKNKDKEKSSKNQDKDRSKSKEKDKKKKKKKYSKSKSVSKSKSKFKYKSQSPSPSNNNHKLNQSSESEKSSNHKKKKIKKNISNDEIKPLKSSQKQQSSQQQPQPPLQQQQSQTIQNQQQNQQQQQEKTFPLQQPQQPNQMNQERNSQENIQMVPTQKQMPGAYFPHQQFPQFPNFYDVNKGGIAPGGITPFGMPYFMPPGMIMQPHHFKPPPMFQPGYNQFPPRFMPAPFVQGMPQMHDMKFQEQMEERQNESNVALQNQQKFPKFGLQSGGGGTGVGSSSNQQGTGGNVGTTNTQNNMNPMYKKNFQKGQNKNFIPHNQKINWGDHSQNLQQNRRKDSARKKLQDGCLFKNISQIPKAVEVFANTQVSLKVAEPNLYLNISKKLLCDLNKTASDLNMQNTTKSINKFLTNLTEIQKKEKENKDKQISKSQQKKKQKLKPGDNQNSDSIQTSNKQISVMEEVEFLSYLHETKDLNHIQYYGNFENYKIGAAIQPLNFEVCEEQQNLFEEAKQLFLKNFND